MQRLVKQPVVQRVFKQISTPTSSSSTAAPTTTLTNHTRTVHNSSNPHQSNKQWQQMQMEQPEQTQADAIEEATPLIDNIFKSNNLLAYTHAHVRTQRFTPLDRASAQLGQFDRLQKHSAINPFNLQRGGTTTATTTATTTTTPSTDIFHNTSHDTFHHLNSRFGDVTAMWRTKLQTQTGQAAYNVETTAYKAPIQQLQQHQHLHSESIGVQDPIRSIQMGQKVSKKVSKAKAAGY